MVPRLSLAAGERFLLTVARRIESIQSRIRTGTPTVEARVGVTAAVTVPPASARIASTVSTGAASVASRARVALPPAIRVRPSLRLSAPSVAARLYAVAPGAARIASTIASGAASVASRVRAREQAASRVRASVAFSAPIEVGSRVRIRAARVGYPAYLLDAIEGDYFRPVYLATVGSLNLCSTSHSISHGGRSYTGNGISNLSTLTSRLRIEAERLDLEVASNDAPLRRLWSQDLNRAAVKLYLSHLTDSGTLAGSPVLVWSGSVAGVHEDAKQAKQYIHCESVLSALNQSRDFYFTPESQEGRYRQDRFFEFTENLGDRTFQWAGREINLADLRHLSITL